MKKKIFFLLVVLFCTTTSGFSQAGKFTGTWQGTLDVGNGIELRIVFHISADDKGGVATTADSPDQSAYGFICDTTVITGNNIIIEMKKLGASFSGTMQNDSTIGGTFVQQADIPLVLKKTEKITARNRPQTPVPLSLIKAKMCNTAMLIGH